MKRIIFTFALLLTLYHSNAQNDSALVNDIKRFQQGLLNEYNDPKLSPIKPGSKEKFKGIHFFPSDSRYAVRAKFVRTKDEKIFEMPTSGTEKRMYVKYAEAVFTLQGKEYKLSIYQSVDLAKNREYRDYLFIPFRDATSGKETYGGGRYIDLTIPYGDSILINFNKAYHPYCAYTEGYNCPIPPRENTLPIKIEAGVRF
ncbi:MAG: DUF1684 domain-containing protein [Panacibacter sp.]